MPARNIFRTINSYLIKKFLAVEETKSKIIEHPRNILIVRQHNQFGDMLASVSLFRALKETFPNSNLTVFASPQNVRPIEKNPFIDNLFVYDQKKFFSLTYIRQLIKEIKRDYDLAIVPATVAISSTSCILVGLTNARAKVGPKSLNGKENKLCEIFHIRIDLDWRKHPDAHVSDFIQDIIRPLGIRTDNFSSVIPISAEDFRFADEFIKQLDLQEGEKLIGIHLGAAKPQNRWPLYKFLDLLKEIDRSYKAKIYFTCGKADAVELEFMKKNYAKTKNYRNKTVPQLAALIERSHLFISNDTGVMHVAGTTTTPLISLFGPTNPYNWAPLGSNKFFIKKSEFIDDITVDDVFGLIKYLI